MCVIAGYAGGRRAAPILIEMLKKVEYFDGGMATGIAYLNPGSVSIPKEGSTPSYMVLEGGIFTAKSLEGEITFTFSLGE